MSLLVIEDDDKFLELMRLTLGLKSIRVARSMHEAMDLIDQSHPEVIMLDLALPDSTIEQSISRIHELKSRSNNAAVIVITGHPQPEKFEADAQERGALCVLSKDKGFFNSLSRALIATGKHHSFCASEGIISEIEKTVSKIVGGGNVT